MSIAANHLEPRAHDAGADPGATERPGYQVFMLVLSVFALLALSVQLLGDADAETTVVLSYVDLIVCAIFFVDFLVSLWKAPSRMHYLRTWGWIDLISSIPVIDAARWARIGRILRIIRILRAMKIAGGFFGRRRAENSVLAALLAVVVLVTLCSMLMVVLEKSPGSTITSAETAVWWALATITTVGYGDVAPVTSEGRIVAAALMVAGVGVFSTLSGVLAAWMVAPATRSCARSGTSCGNCAPR
jgi:voltage-gated potassium channel